MNGFGGRFGRLVGGGRAVKVLVVDDHAMIRQGLASLFTLAEPGADVLSAADAEEALRLAAGASDLDVILLDLALPGVRGVAIVGELSRLCPGAPVVVLSASEDPGDVREALAAGALGFIPKSSSPQTLLAAVRLVLGGDIYLPPFMAQGAGTGHGVGAPALTPRQAEVLAMMAEGRSNGAIGLRLSMAEKTVKTHVSAIFRALDVRNREEAVAHARRAGLI